MFDSTLTRLYGNFSNVSFFLSDSQNEVDTLFRRDCYVISKLLPVDVYVAAKTDV